MNVLVDTPVWSLALRRHSGDLSREDANIRDLLAELIREGRVLMVGPIRQELLSGIRDHSQYTRLRDHLRGFPDTELRTSDYEQAAEMCNRCRSSGIAPSSVDMMICAAAVRARAAIFTTDHDFYRYSEILRLHLFAYE